MRKGSELIYEQLQLASMAVHGLYEHLCEEGGVNGPTPELETQIEATRAVGRSIREAMAELRVLTEAA